MKIDFGTGAGVSECHHLQFGNGDGQLDFSQSRGKIEVELDSSTDAQSSSIVLGARPLWSIIFRCPPAPGRPLDHDAVRRDVELITDKALPPIFVESWIGNIENGDEVLEGGIKKVGGGLGFNGEWEGPSGCRRRIEIVVFMVNSVSVAPPVVVFETVMLSAASPSAPLSVPEEKLRVIAASSSSSLIT